MWTPTRPLFSFGAKVLFVGIMLSVFQQFIGINAVLYYGPLMFKNAGFTTNVSLLQTIVVGIALVVFTLVALVTVDRWGRKPLLITGAVIMAVAMFALGTPVRCACRGHAGRWRGRRSISPASRFPGARSSG